ncbi:hypothetical protein BB934_05575 [Microvirga ossetica]|uniref:HEPN AbiU2-like domain-containing protein n=1 Tax=Microvirga ossetica TaxID=1882682 RepID=A0A1B2ECQ8_9HYPH|nr:hypothetical protein [Microvirga ossetica]ANY77770.1 hypothetical protein BB934_05575 [Microvirga ossetica]
MDLAPNERLSIVRLRLERTKELITEVINLHAQRLALLPSFDQYFEAPPSAPIFTFMMTITQFEISHVCRLWDKPELSGFGLPSIAALLESPEVFEVIAKIAEGKTPESPENPAKIERLRTAIEAINEAENSEEIQRVRNHRNKFIAHPVVKTREERRRSYEIARTDDTEFLINTAIRAASTLAWAESGEELDYSLVQHQARAEANDFFGKVVWPKPDH